MTLEDTESGPSDFPTAAAQRLGQRQAAATVNCGTMLPVFPLDLKLSRFTTSITQTYLAPGDSPDAYRASRPCPAYYEPFARNEESPSLLATCRYRTRTSRHSRNLNMEIPQ